MKFDGMFKVTAAGRINLIGEHIDYCGGKVLPAALSLCNAVYVRPNGTDRINLSWTDLKETVTLGIGNLSAYRGLKYAKYQAGSAYFWQQEGHRVVGCDMLYNCSVPFGSGLSSSAAIEVSTIAALAVAAGEEYDPVEVALTAQRAECEYVGVNCGIMDQYAAACGKKGHAILLDCKTLEREYLPVALGECVLVVANSNKPHDLVESKYNERRAETDEALSILKERTGIECLADLTEENLRRYGHLLSPTVLKRAEHVVSECGRVRRAAEAMKKGDIRLFGQLLRESHASLSRLYEVTGRELDSLAGAANAHQACLGSRMTGAGFGGCTVSVVERAGAEDFRAYVAARYERETGYKPSFYETEIADGITAEKL